jgi:hypothetical protein
MKNQTEQRKEIYRRISEAIEKHIGESITSRSIYAIKVELQHVLMKLAQEGEIDASKLQKDGEVQIRQDRDNPHQLVFQLPYWLEEWLLALPVEEVLEKPPEGETKAQEEQRRIMNEEMARLPIYETS